MTEDVVIRIPVESAIDASVLRRKTPRHTARIKQMDLEDIKEQGLFVPLVKSSTWNCRRLMRPTICPISAAWSTI